MYTFSSNNTFKYFLNKDLKCINKSNKFINPVFVYKKNKKDIKKDILLLSNQMSNQNDKIKNYNYKEIKNILELKCSYVYKYYQNKINPLLEDKYILYFELYNNNYLTFEFIFIDHINSFKISFEQTIESIIKSFFDSVIKLNYVNTHKRKIYLLKKIQSLINME